MHIARGVLIFGALAGVILALPFSRTLHAYRPTPLALLEASAPLGSDPITSSHDRVRFLERRLARDPDDIDVLNQLSVLYLQRLRETGDFADLDLAQRASRRSLSIVPAVRNIAGLTTRTMAEFASHEFGAARDDAQSLTKLDGSGTSYALLGDAYAELGNYEAAEDAYAQLRRFVGSADENVATRRARMALLRGQSEVAKDALSTALAMELNRSSPSRERVAWYSWQLGDTAFSTGDYSTARSRYEDALKVYPGYFRARASSGRLAAAEGDYRQAEADYELAIAALPDPTFVAELGDVYELAGDRVAAKREYGLVEVICRLTMTNGSMYNRQLSMFEADHDRKPTETYRSAAREYAVRADVLGADTLAWAALKAGKVAQARAAIKAALRFGTNDPRMLYHAGMIARAAGNKREARTMLDRALRLSPGFDPLQSRVARSVLAELDHNPPAPGI